jgi:hypothetical protein
MEDVKKMPNQEADNATEGGKKRPRLSEKHLKTLPHGKDAVPQIEDSHATLTAASDAPDEDNPQ